MSQRGVERALGKLVTDEGFRELFFAEPESAALRLGVDLSPQELAALRHIPITALTDFSHRLDDRICRLHVPSRPSEEEQLS
jgi:hypothetical protein